MRVPLSAGLMLALLSGAPATAQWVELGAQAGRIGDERGASHGALQLSASALWAGAGGSARVEGSGARLDGGSLLGSAQAAGELRALQRGVLGLRLGAEAGVAGSDGGYRGARGALRPRLELAGAGWGASLGPELGAAGEAQPRAELGSLLPGGGSSGGGRVAWRAVRGARAEVWGGSGPLAVRASWAASQAGVEWWRDLAASATLHRGPLAVSGSVGQCSGEAAERWASAGARLELGAGVALQAAVGRYPADPLLGRAGGRFATLGASVARGAARRSRAGVRAAGGAVPLALRAAPGARVEIVGDFTGWRPESVPELRPGHFVYTARLAPGRYRFVFRVDGEVRLPRGFESESDAFGGRSAVLRVEA